MQGCQFVKRSAWVKSPCLTKDQRVLRPLPRSFCLTSIKLQTFCRTQRTPVFQQRLRGVRQQFLRPLLRCRIPSQLTWCYFRWRLQFQALLQPWLPLLQPRPFRKTLRVTLKWEGLFIGFFFSSLAVPKVSLSSKGVIYVSFLSQEIPCYQVFISSVFFLTRVSPRFIFCPFSLSKFVTSVNSNGNIWTHVFLRP